MKNAVEDYSRSLTKLRDAIAGSAQDDPLSKAYEDIGLGNTVVDPEYDQKEVELDLAYRHSHGLPPGSQDVGKIDRGVGDLLM